MSDQRVLMVSFYFPPCGGVSVQRSLKFAKCLGRFGWQPVVLTDEESTFRYLPRDAALLDELDPNVLVIRTPNHRRELVSQWLHRLRLDAATRFLTPVDLHYSWAKQASGVATSIADSGGADVIYTTSGPPSAHLVGLSLKNKRGLPWVADFRDPWTQWHAYRPPTPVHRWIDERLERAILREADIVIANTSGSRGLLLDKYGQAFADKVVVIPNGYDEDDFAGAAHRTDDRFVLTYTGTVYGEYQDPSNKEFPRAFFTGLERLLRENPVLVGSLRIRFIGVFSEANQKVLDDLGLRGVVDVLGPMEHRQALSLTMGSDATLLLMCGWPGNMVQGKLYEMLRVGKPILALAPEGDARAILAEAGNPYFAAPDDPASVRDTLLALLNDWRAGALSGFGLDTGYIRGFDRVCLAGQLAESFDSVTRNTRRMPVGLER